MYPRMFDFLSELVRRSPRRANIIIIRHNLSPNLLGLRQKCAPYRCDIGLISFDSADPVFGQVSLRTTRSSQSGAMHICHGWHMWVCSVRYPRTVFCAASLGLMNHPHQSSHSRYVIWGETIKGEDSGGGQFKSIKTI